LGDFVVVADQDDLVQLISQSPIVIVGFEETFEGNLTQVGHLGAPLFCDYVQVINS
jgi:hypothetical protein